MSMARADLLQQYAEGWSKGDANIIAASLDDNYQLDDPNSGSIPKAGLSKYLAGLVELVDNIRGTSGQQPFMEFTELVTSEEGNLLTAWAWWSIPNTSIQGAALIKVGDNGVVSERLAYYTPLPEG